MQSDIRTQMAAEEPMKLEQKRSTDCFMALMNLEGRKKHDFENSSISLSRKKGIIQVFAWVFPGL